MTNTKKLTPVLVVDAIEPCLQFWVDRLGFQKTVEVPHDGRLGFVILVDGSTEVMLQTRASVAADVPSLRDEPFRTALFVEVQSLDRVKKALAGVPLVFDERRTFYGAREICAREPGGNAITFAEFDTAAG